MASLGAALNSPHPVHGTEDLLSEKPDHRARFNMFRAKNYAPISRSTLNQPFGTGLLFCLKLIRAPAGLCQFCVKVPENVGEISWQRTQPDTVAHNARSPWQVFFIYFQQFLVQLIRQMLETASLDSILNELEEWEAFLKAEPELIHKLRSFDEAAKPSQKPPSPARPKGPSL